MKGSGDATEWCERDRFEGGVSWLAYPDERMQRASHVLAVDSDVWVVDPVDVPNLDALLAEFGTVRGVVLLLDRHKRDCAAVAERHGVSVWVPEFIDGVESDIDASTERFHDELGDSGFELHELINNRVWQEAFLFNADSGVLVVPEAVGTTDFFRVGEERLGVHPMLRLTPPVKLRQFEPERILVGHGAGIHERAANALDEALDGSRVRAPRLAMKNIRSILPI